MTQPSDLNQGRTALVCALLLILSTFTPIEWRIFVTVPLGVATLWVAFLMLKRSWRNDGG